MRKQRSVAIVHQLIVLHAAALVLLAGCQKPDFNGKEIRFSARSLPEAGTKAAYTGNKDDSNFERIAWESGDKIRIYNDKATCSGNPSYKWADYTVGSVASSTDRYSTGQLNVSSSRGGLTWGTGTHTFYGVYPSPETNDAAGRQDLSDFTGSIQQTQTGEQSTIDAWAGTGKVYYPSNNKPILVGYQQIAAGGTGTLDFSPAYSAFHISAGVEENMTVKSVELRSASKKLWGNFTVSRSGSNWNFSCQTATDAADRTVTFTLPGGGVNITTTDILELVLFTLPQDLDDLTLAFNVTVGVTLKTLTLELKRSDSSAVTFKACKKSYIKGLLVPGSVWTVDDATVVKMQESVEDWTDADSTLEYDDTDPVVNASKIAAGGSAGNYNFSVYAPKGQTWKIQVLDGIAGSPVSSIRITQNGKYNNGDPISNSDYGTLTGEIGNPAKIDFTLSGGSGTFWLSFSIIAGSVEYSINSEVTENRTNTPMEITL